jgi:peroxiredoxin
MDLVHLPVRAIRKFSERFTFCGKVAKPPSSRQHAIMAIESLDSIPLGTPASEFSLPDVVTGETVSLSALPESRALLIMFICRHCPYVVHVREEILRIAHHYQPKGVRFIAICSNDSAAYPDDAPDKLREMAVTHNFPFPLLHDETQAVARAYDAQCTPDFFLFDSKRRLNYHGRLDDSTPSNGVPLTGREMRRALDAVLGGLDAPAVQKPSIGCSIKWKPGKTGS